MNIELSYIRCENIDKVVDLVERRLNGNLREITAQIPEEIPDSYEVYLQNNKKRKVAVSQPKEGWITVVESKEVNDYTMLLAISKELNTDVISLAQYDTVGTWGYVEIHSGNIKNCYFSDEDDAIEELITQIRNKNNITESMTLFREAVQKKEGEWKVIQAR